MSTAKMLSINYYKYLCQKIGSEKKVRFRRLAYTISDIGTDNNHITSGSKGEGLNFSSSDFDLMTVDYNYKVYESDRHDRDVIFHDNKIPLIMDTDDSPPCFTLLRLLNNTYEQDSRLNQIIENNSQGSLLSSELYKIMHMDRMNLSSPFFKNNKIHGPCISDEDDIFDFAFCLKCDHWISQAKPWIYRPRATWPSADLISKISSCGVLIVPIGCKGSSNENLQWRISFSVSEKSLLFSFSHTQLLCYALLKILLKKIVERHDDLKSLLCSYFLKTLMFLISEESDPSIWRPDNIIPCFMACFKRLLYCVEYETLLHYFIPDNNLFYLRFNVTNKDKLTKVLINSYKQGIQCFHHSESLCDFKGLICEVDSMKEINHILKLNTEGLFILSDYNNLLYNLLHHSKTVLSRDIFTLYLSKAHMCIPQKSQNQPISNNKQEYYKYRRDLSHLLIGTQSDALSGWMLLACFFYVHKNYLISLDIIHYALTKCTDEKEPVLVKDIQLNQNQKSVLNFMKHENLYTAMKLITVQCVMFCSNSQLLPSELHISSMFQVYYKNQNFPFYPVYLARILSCYCYLHLHDMTSCLQVLHLFMRTETEIFNRDEDSSNYEMYLKNECHHDNSNYLLNGYFRTLFFPRQLV